MTGAEKFVRYAIAIGAMKLFPEWTVLKSGRRSPYFFNSGIFNTGKKLIELVEPIAAIVKSLPYTEYTDIIFGPTYKGIPLACEVSTTMWRKYKMNLGFAFNRKEEKDHGEGGVIVGPSLKRKNVCIVDDTMTTGTSSGEAVDIIRAKGGTPLVCVIAFDRQERGTDTDLSAVQKFEHNYKIPVRSAATLTDLITVLEKDVQSNHPTIPNSKKALKEIFIYRQKYAGADIA